MFRFSSTILLIVVLSVFGLRGPANAASPATIISPTNGSTLSGPTVTFSWNTGVGVSQYFLYVGTSVGANNLYGQSVGLSLSATVTGLPTNGSTIYVRLYSNLPSGWYFNDYTYKAAAMAQARNNVVHQAYYALSTAANGTSAQMIGGNYAGSWNWLNSDNNAYKKVLGWYLCNASDWAVSGDGSGCPALDPYVSFYANPSGYGYSTIGIPYAFYGRGGQCTYFANLVVYRSAVYTSSFPRLSDMWTAGNPNMQQVQFGDVIQRYADPSGAINHVAIVVQVYTTAGSVTSVDVVDSNWVSDSGAGNHEIIARHNLLMSALQGHFRIWKVPGY